MADIKRTFSGTIPEYYDRCLGPAWFDVFARELVERVPAKPPGDVLEIACGTGLVTRRLRERIDPAVRLVASDLSQAMLAYAQDKLARHPGIEWREADAANLPFGDSQFGAVICAFGIMFVPDKRAAFGEMRRVLTKDGLLIFDVWDSIEHSAHHVACAKVFEETFPGDDQMRFTIPYEMYDVAVLRELLAEAHFVDVSIEKKRLALGRVSAETIATGQIRGTPRSLLIEQRGVSLDEMVRRVTSALAKVGGADPYVGTAQAITVTARATR